MGLGWDETVPPAVSKSFNRWIKKTEKAHLNHIDRRIKGRFVPLEESLVIFTDASSQAQAAAAYLYCEGEQECEGRLWAARQKISSLNRADSISRLELEAAVLGVDLGRQICSSMGWDMNRVLYFTDSTTVLWWLRTHRELDVFVGNRVCKILENSSLAQWFHVRTHQNPADIPTRGMSGKKLAECDLWWNGPEFFTLSKGDWPPQPEAVESRQCHEGYRQEEKRRLEKWFFHMKRQENYWLDEFWLDVVGRFEDLARGFSIAYQIFSISGKFTRYYYCTTKELSIRYLQNAVFRAAQAELKDLQDSLKLDRETPKEYKELRPFLIMKE